MVGFQEHTEVQEIWKPNHMIPVHTEVSTPFGLWDNFYSLCIG